MVEIQVQMHKRNRVKIPDKTVAVFSSKECAEKGFLSHWKISGRRTYPLIFSSYQSEYLPVFYSFPNGCCLFSTELWKTDEEIVEGTAFPKGFLLFGGSFVLPPINKRHRLEESPNGAFLCSKIPIRKRGTDNHLSERKEETVCNKKQKSGWATFSF